jgi:hypothetical protein
MDNLYRTRTGEQKPQGNRANTTDLGEHSKAGVTILKGGEIMDKLTRQEKIDIGLIRPYSLTSDRLIVEDIEKGYTVKKIAQIYNRDIDDLKEHIEKIKGKIKSRRCKGEDNNFKELYAAIWGKAAKDDIKKVKGMIYTELKNIGVSKSEIRRFIDENSSRIEQDVQAAVHKEAQDWPCITNAQTVRTQYQIRNKYVRIFESEGVA